MMRESRKVFFILSLLAWLSCSPAGICAAQTATPSLQPLATVNGVAVTRQALEWADLQIRVLLPRRGQPASDAEPSRWRDDLLQNLIDRELLYQQARQRNIGIPEADQERAWRELSASMGGKNALREYRERVGLSADQVTADLRKGLMINRFLQREVLGQIRVGDAEIIAFYNRHPDYFEQPEQIRVRHLLIAAKDLNDPSEREKALTRIRDLQARIRQGESLGALALDYSDCPSRARGGDIGYFSRAQVEPEFAEAAFALREKGDISDIVETRHGFEIIQILDRKPPGRISLKDARRPIEQALRRVKSRASVDACLAGLKKKAVIEVR